MARGPRGGPFVLSFVQAYLGDDEIHYLHVPGAMILRVGSVCLLVWLLARMPGGTVTS